jgi:ferritin-like metal-binding protein YciE
MKIDNLKQLYLQELKDLYDANEQANATTDKLIKAATSPELKAALQRSIEGAEKGNQHIKTILDRHGEGVGNVTCKGMKGLTREAEEHVLDVSYGDDSVRDAMLISQYQRMAHYAITGYGSVEAFAKRLDLLEDARTLETCKEETMEGDLRFTQLAEGSINEAALAA